MRIEYTGKDLQEFERWAEVVGLSLTLTKDGYKDRSTAGWFGKWLRKGKAETIAEWENRDKAGTRGRGKRL